MEKIDIYGQENRAYRLEIIKSQSNYRGNHSELFINRIKDKAYISAIAGLYYIHFRTSKSIKSIGDFPPIAVNRRIGKEITKFNNVDFPNYFIPESQCLEFWDRVNNENKNTFLDYLEVKIRQTIDYVSKVTLLSWEELSLDKRTGDYKYEEVKGLSSLPGIPPLVSPDFYFEHFAKDQTDQANAINELSVIEAHEQNHGIFCFITESDITKKILSGVDTEVKVRYSKYYKMPVEILARMSQLKNYYGMGPDDLFTKDHYYYAEKNYGKDYGGSAELQIKELFKMVTPQKEDIFIELMNELPI